MFKLLSVMIISLFFLGCATTNEPQRQTYMFQTVTPELAVLVQDAYEKDTCYICGMNLVKYYKTNHSASYEGKKFQYCSLHCLEDHLGQGITLKNPQVVDVSSLKFINVSDAYYVVGSKQRGTMSRVSKYAFLKEEDAKKFNSLNGGLIMDFNAARKKAQEDFKYYK